MTKLNKAERFIAYFLIVWTAIHIILWVTAQEADYALKEQFWPFVSGDTSFINDLPKTYDFREFIIYTFVPWTLFLMGDGLVKHSEES
jgi:hypothetical protein